MHNVLWIGLNVLFYFHLSGLLSLSCSGC